jgi:hypothetical protein
VLTFFPRFANRRQVSVIQDVHINQEGSPLTYRPSEESTKEVAVRRDRSTFLPWGLLGLVLANALTVCGCGGANSEGAAASTEEGRRFNSMQKLGALQSKEDIAAKKKEALAEIARKKGGATGR